jgi:hypothetical protein
MSDIGPGDVVECLDARGATRALQVGAVYRVVRNDVVRNCRLPHLDGLPCVWLVGVPPSDCGNGRATRRFRAIRPADDSFTEQVRKCRPIKPREPVSC